MFWPSRWLPESGSGAQLLLCMPDMTGSHQVSLQSALLRCACKNSSTQQRCSSNEVFSLATTMCQHIEWSMALKKYLTHFEYHVVVIMHLRSEYEKGSLSSVRKSCQLRVAFEETHTSLNCFVAEALLLGFALSKRFEQTLSQTMVFFATGETHPFKTIV